MQAHTSAAFTPERLFGFCLNSAILMCFFICQANATAYAADSNSDQLSQIFELQALKIKAPERSPLSRPRSDATGSYWSLDLSKMPNIPVKQLINEIATADIHDYGMGQRLSLSIRSTSPQQTLVLLDGIPINPPQGGGSDLSLYNLEDAQYIEVFRGLDASTYGPGALGGVLSITTIKPRDDEKSTGLHINARTAYGSQNEFMLKLNSSYQWKTGEVSFAAKGKQYDGDFQFIDEHGQRRKRENNEGRQLSFNVSIANHWSKDLQLSLHTHLLFNERGIPGPEQSITPYAFQTDKKWLSGGTLYIQKLLSLPMTSTVHAGFRQEWFHYEDPAPPIGAAQSHQQELFTIYTNVLSEIEISASNILTLQLGGESNWLQDPQVNNPYQNNIFLAAMEEFGFFKKQTIVQARLRSDFIVPQNVAYLSPELGLRQRILASTSPKLRWFALLNLGRAIRIPSFYERFLFVDGFRPNPDLKEETAYEADLSTEIVTTYLKAHIGFFYRRIFNLILFVPTGASTIQAQNFYFTNTYGPEIDIQGGSRLAWKFAYSYNKSSFGDAQDLQLPGFAPHHASFRIHYDMPIAPNSHANKQTATVIKPWITAQYQSAMFLDRLNNLKEEGRVFFHVGIDLMHFWGFSLFFQAHNLLNKRDAVDALQYPLRGRSFHISLQYQNFFPNASIGIQ